MTGGRKAPSAPTFDDPKKSFEAAITAEIGALPERYGAELEYRPKFAEVNVATLEQLAPRLAALSTGLEQRLSPEVAAARQALQRRIGTMGQGLPTSLEEAYRRRFAAEEGMGGRLGSPIGSASIARQLALVEAARESQIASEALGLTQGRSPIFGSAGSLMSGVSGGPGLTGQYVQPQLGLAGQLAGVRSNIYGQQLQAETAQRGQNLQFAGDVIGGVFGAAGAAGGFGSLVGSGQAGAASLGSLDPSDPFRGQMPFRYGG